VGKLKDSGSDEATEGQRVTTAGSPQIRRQLLTKIDPSVFFTISWYSVIYTVYPHSKNRQ